jgi:hypothetical protein
MGFFSLPVGTASVAALGVESEGSNYAFITVETDSVRIRFDGGDPTTVGHLCPPGAIITLDGGKEVQGFRVIAMTIGATLRVTHQKRRRA